MLKKLVLALVFAVAAIAPAQAAFAPTWALSQNIFGPAGGNRTVIGTVTMGSADTYVTGGFTVQPAVFGFANQIVTLQFGPPSTGGFFPISTIGTGSATVKFNQPAQTGASNIAAIATTATITVPGPLTANSVIQCALDDAATGGGGTGTWAVTAAVASCKFASATTFTITSTAAAPTNGGNLTYMIPNLSQELASATSVANAVIPFVATGN